MFDASLAAYVRRPCSCRTIVPISVVFRYARACSFRSRSGARAWLIHLDDLRGAARSRPQVGRPWSSASAWAVLSLAEGQHPSLTPVERSRARQRLAQGLDVIAGRLAARATGRRFYVHPGALGRLADAPGLVRGGVSAAPDHGADIIAQDEFEGYVRSSVLPELLGRFGMDDQAGRPNVLLRVVDDSVWPFQSGQRSVGRAVVAVDLLESDDPRSRRAGADLLLQR